MIEPRYPRFDWTGVPRYWMEGRPGLTHFLNALHLLFPPAEAWFVRTARQALAELDDSNLAAAVRGFVGQEGSHARAHQTYLGVLEAEGIPIETMRRSVAALFDDVRKAPPWLQRSLMAGAEQHTAAMARWVFERPILDGAHPSPRDLFLWHAAEEIEHKSVAFDILAATHPGYFKRMIGGFIATIELMRLWITLTLKLASKDPQTTVRAVLLDLARGLREGKLPFGILLAAGARYARPSYHPDQDDDRHHATRYLAISPAVRAAFENSTATRSSLDAQGA